MSPTTGDDDVDEDIAWLRNPENRALVDLIRSIKAATLRARTANDDETRRLAHEDVLMLRAQFEKATGLRRFEDQRVVSTAAGQPAHRPPSTAKGLSAIFRRGGDKTEQRYSVARVLFDRWGRNAGMEALRLVLADMGYGLPDENLPGDAPEGIRAPTLRKGVKPLDGPAAAIRLGLANAIGYTLGHEGKRDCPPPDATPRLSSGPPGRSSCSPRLV
jgi:hypothetical protein